MTTPPCPKCKSSKHVKEIRGCRCLSCPPWACSVCKMWEGGPSYEFFDDDEDE